MFLLNKKNFLYRPEFLFILFLSSVILSYSNVYIPYLSISIGFESFTLLLTGFLFGPIVGFFNGLAVDLVTFPWGGSYPFSFLFLLQSGLIGFLGGINFKKWNENSLLTLLIFISIIFSCFYCLIFPELMMWLMLFPVINLLIVFVFGKNVDSLRWLIILNLSVYLCSFGLGTIGSIFLNPIGSPLLFLRVRAFKEIAKLVLFASMFGALRKWIS